MRLLRSVLVINGLLACCATVPALAQETARTQAEVRQLLDFVAASGCQFQRNGEWHDARAARAHLERKYEYLRERKLVPDAETFISRAATESNLSGKPYQVRCRNAQPIPSAQWLNAELKRLRAGQA